MIAIPTLLWAHKYQDMYNHCKRVPISDTDQVRKLDEFLRPHIDDDNAMDEPSLRMGGDVIDVIFLASQQVCATLVHGGTMIYCVYINKGC